MFGFGKWFGASSWSNHWAGHCRLSYKIHFLSHITIQSRNDLLLLYRIKEDNTSKRWFFFFAFQVAHEAHTIELFHRSNLLQMPNHRMVDVEFFSNFSCSCKGIGFNDGSQLVVVNFQWPATMLLNYRALVSLAKVLEPPLHCMLTAPVPNVLLMLQRSLHCFMTHFEFKQENRSNLLFV